MKDLEISTAMVDEAEMQIFELKNANQVLNLKYEQLQKLYEDKSRLNYELEQFNESKKLMNRKFPGFSLERVLDRCEVLEEKLLELQKKIGDTEGDYMDYEREIKKERQLSAIKSKELEEMERK